MIKEYCQQYFFKFPDNATNIALNELSKKFSIDYNSKGLKDLQYCIKIGKQFRYDMIL